MENSPKIRLTINELPQRAEKISPEEVNKIFGGFGEAGSSCDNDCGCTSNRCIIEPGESIGFCA